MSRESKAPEAPSTAARVVSPNRTQLEFGTYDIDRLVAQDHRVRTIWAAVERMNLAPFYAEIKSREGSAGRPAFDPKMMLALWLFAISEGIGSARHLARLCERDHAYMWICGGLKPNYHDLSDFRGAHGAKLDTLLSELLASLMKVGVLKLKRVAQDGMRLRAHAGVSSFRRGSTLERCLVEAKAQVETLARELEDDPAASSEREKAAQRRAAEERQQAVERALQTLPDVVAARKRSQRARENQAKRAGKLFDEKKSEPRVSTTDPDARVMKMADGGFRPAYNVQFATDAESRIIVGVDVTSIGADSGQMAPMLEQLERRTGRRPAEYLVDGGFASLKSIDAVEASGTRVYAPVASHFKTTKIDPHARKAADTKRTFAWRTRMATDEAKRIYKERASTAETVHAEMRTWRGLGQLRVRGTEKVRATILLQALTYNLLHSAKR